MNNFLYYLKIFNMFEYLRKKLFDFRSGFIIRKAYDYIEYNFIA